jgi:hypothetical protein
MPIGERTPRELVRCITDRATAALGFRAGTEGPVFALIADFARALARPAAPPAGPLPIGQVMVAIVAVEGRDADGLKSLPFGVEPFLTRSVGSEVEVDTVHGGVFDQSTFEASTGARGGWAGIICVSYRHLVPACQLAAKLGQRHART